MTALRRVLFPLRLVAARFSQRLGRFALVAVGLATAAAMLAAVLAGGLVAQDRSLARALGELPEPSRAVRAVWFGVPAQAPEGQRGLDRIVRRALAPVARGRPVEVVLLRRSRIGGAIVDLGAVDGLRRWVRLASGRLPRRCEPARCEVVRLAGTGPTPRLAGFRLVVVGRGALVSDVLLGRFVDPGAYHQPATPPLLLAEGVDALAAAPAFASFYRGYAWVLPLADARVRAWETESFGEGVAQARSTLRSAAVEFDLEAPVTEVADAGATSRAAARRLLLIGGQACALLLAFAVLAAATLRRDAAAARRRLTWFGARRWQLELVTAAEGASVAVAGTAVGWAAGVGLAALVAARAGAPVRAVLAHSVLSPSALAAAAALAAVSAAVLVLAVRARPLRVGGLSFSPVDVAALGALAAVGLALARGSTDDATLAREGGVSVLLLLLPGLVAFVAAVVCARALVPGLRALERVSRRGAVPLRLAALSLARNPGYAAVAIGFLTISLGLALFAETYRSTLARGQEDQAAYAVPADAVVREDIQKLVKPLAAAPLTRFREVTRGGEALPVVRRSGSVAKLEGSSAVTVLGLEGRAIGSLEGWRDDFASRPSDELARLVDPPGSTALRGILLPEGARELTLPVAVTGHPVGMTASVVTADGRAVPLELGQTRGRARVTLRARIPPEARGGRLVALTLVPPYRIEEPGAAAGTPARGVLTAGRLHVVGERTSSFRFDDWIASNPSLSAVAAGPRTEFHYSLTNQIVSRFRPRQPSDEGRIPVLATPRLAAAAGEGGALPVDLGGGQTVATRVVATVDRFPTIEGDAVVADRELVSTALEAATPGSGEPDEIWLSAREGGEAPLRTVLARPPFHVLDATTREEVAAGLRGDPLARAVFLTLASAALVALALALVGLLLGVVGDLRDERGEFFDLEAQGASPARLRRQVGLRAAIVGAVGVAGGAGTGALLSLLVVDLVRVTANAARPEPPLLVSVDWPVVGLAVAAYVAVAGAVVAFATWRAFGGEAVPARASELGA